VGFCASASGTLSAFGVESEPSMLNHSSTQKSAVSGLGSVAYRWNRFNADLEDEQCFGASEAALVN
jgi:hypothetical protein